jgi:hypothetical protein
MEFSSTGIPEYVQNYLGQIFPGVIFQYGRNLSLNSDIQYRNQYITFYYQDIISEFSAVYKYFRYEMPEEFNSLLDSLYDSNSKKTIPDDTLIKGYAYLTLLSQYNSKGLDLRNIYKIIVSKDPLQYPKYDNNGILQEPTILYYSVIVDFFGEAGENYWKHAELHYRIKSKEIQYDYGFIKMNNGVLQKIYN